MDALIVPEKHRDQHRDGMHRYQTTGEERVVNRRIEIEAINKAGRIFPVELSIIPMKSDGENLFVGFVRDISERRRSEARHTFMLELSDLLRDGETADALQDVCALMGRYFHVTRVGYGQLDAIEDIFEYSVCWTDGTVPPLLGRYPASAFGPKIVAKLGRGETVEVADLFSDSLSDDVQTQSTAESVDTRSILVVPFLRAGRLRTIIYLNDRAARAWEPHEVEFMEEIADRTRQVIERREAETALQALNSSLEARVEQRTSALHAAEEALRQSQKMEAIGQLTGGIAHDFNNFLQGISGSLDVVRRRVTEGRLEDVHRFIDGAAESARRAAGLTHRLLAFARRQPITPRSVDVTSLVASMEDLLRRSLGERIALELALCQDPWRTRCDQNQLESAVLNLAINARDAMAGEGRLVIQTRNADLDALAVSKLRDVEPGQYVAIAVTDSGVGIDEETISRIFEPFFTTKGLGQGTGLGLSMIYGFVGQSGGCVHVESEIGEGSTFTIFMPRLEQADAEQDFVRAAPNEQTGAKDGETILVVEDDSIVRGLVVEALTELGYSVIEAADGQGGSDILQSAQRLDLLITDIGLPGVDGRRVADLGRKARPHLKVLFMTAYAESAARASGFLGPGMSLLAKPFEMETFANRVRDLLGRS
jgi:signal transduction histidine kinase